MCLCWLLIICNNKELFIRTNYFGTYKTPKGNNKNSNEDKQILFMEKQRSYHSTVS